MSITEEDFRFSRRLRKYFSLHGFPRWLRGKQTTCQCRRLRLDPWIEKIPWKREWQPTPIFLPEKFHGQRSLAGLQSMGSQKSQTQLNNLTATTTNLYKTCRLLLWTQGLSLNPRRPDCQLKVVLWLSLFEFPWVTLSRHKGNICTWFRPGVCARVWLSW